jgi:predicted nucleic acid-binding protein
VLVDTSAIVALFDDDDHWHQAAERFFHEEDFSWVTVDVTAHEVYTRVRYDRDCVRALQHYDFLRSGSTTVISFIREDEISARALLEKYSDHKISFHDALCAADMLRIGAYRAFAFDKHFWIMGFEMLPEWI